MRVKLEDVCERGSSNLKQSDVVDMEGDYPIYGASGYISNDQMTAVRLLEK